MSELNLAAYRLTVSARDSIYETCCQNGRLVDVESAIYDLAYRGGEAARQLLKTCDDQPVYIALGDRNRPLSLPCDTVLFETTFSVQLDHRTVEVLNLYREAHDNNQLPIDCREAYSADPEIILSRLIYIGKRARFVIERASKRALFPLCAIDVPTRINTA